jgi:hypothetical protein
MQGRGSEISDQPGTLKQTRITHAKDGSDSHRCILDVLMMSKFMGKRTHQGIFSRLKSWLISKPAPLSDIDQARQLIAAIDRGGIPLNPAKVNAIARNLGLEVSRSAPLEQTIDRIRLALARA